MIISENERVSEKSAARSRKNRQKCGKKEKESFRRLFTTQGRAEIRTERRMDRLKERTDGQMDGRMDGRTDGQQTDINREFLHILQDFVQKAIMVCLCTQIVSV